MVSDSQKAVTHPNSSQCHIRICTAQKDQFSQLLLLHDPAVHKPQHLIQYQQVALTSGQHLSRKADTISNILCFFPLFVFRKR